MGKTGKWLKHLLTGKKDKEKEKEKDKNKDEEKSRDNDTMSSPLSMPTETRSAPPSVSTPKERRRWSFRRSVGAGKELSTPDLPASAPVARGFSEPDRHAMAVAVATAAAADAAVVAAKAAAAVVLLTSGNAGSNMAEEEEAAAATKIQSCFRSYLARKALHALKGLVKLQALVRGHLVRKQATATLRCMQALITVQARARAQRIQMIEETQPGVSRTPISRRSPQHPRFRQTYETERNMEDNVRIVEMDLGESRGSSKSRSSYSITPSERTDHRYSTYSITPSERTDQRYSVYGGSQAYSKADPFQQVSPVPSALTDTSPRGCSGHFEDFAFATAQSSPHYYSPTSVPDPTKTTYIVSHNDGTYSVSSEYPFFPSYMANTESSRAKARSQSAPKQRPESCERQPSRRRPSLEGRNIPRSGRMQRSSSHVGATIGGYRYPWPIKLDKSNVSLKESECGSSSTVQTGNYCRSLVF